MIVDILKKADELKLFTIDLKQDKNKQLFENDENILYWMFKNGYEEQVYAVTRAHVFFSVLKDFILYMHESFDCSERGKVTVAFTISRKPIKDDLFYLCWLLVDEKEFIDNLLYGNISTYDVIKLSVDKKRTIMDKSCEIIGIKQFEDILFNLIYSRSSDLGLIYTLSYMQ